MRFKVIFLFLAVALTSAHFSLAKSSNSKDWRELQPLCREVWDLLPQEEWDGEPEPVGVTKYVLTRRLIATQPEFAFQKYLDSEERHLEKHDVEWDTKKGRFTFQYQKNRRSLYPTRSAIQVISYRGELYIVDGHHRALLSACTGSPMVPVKIMADFSELSRNAFLAALEKMHETEEIFFHRRGSQPVFIPLWEMRDNPYLYLARQITRNVNYDEDEQKVVKADGADPFLILKVNRGVPGQEFYIAAIAKKLFPNYKVGQTLSKDELHQLGEALQVAKWAQNKWRFTVFDRPQSMNKDEVEKLTRRRQKRVLKATCRTELSDAK